MKVTVSLYGRLRDAGHGSRLQVTLPPDATAKQLMSVLSSVLGPKTLAGCALATEDSILSSADRLPKGAKLVALPPVCGG